MVIEIRKPSTGRKSQLCSVLGRILSHSCSIGLESSSESCIANYGRKMHFSKAVCYYSASADAGTQLTGELIESILQTDRYDTIPLLLW